jgi:hypothetical protein
MGWMISMRKQAVKQEFENNSMEVVLEALGKSIARPCFKPFRYKGRVIRGDWSIGSVEQ